MRARAATATAIICALVMTGAVAGQEPTPEPADGTTVVCISIEASEPDGGWTEQRLARALKAGEATIVRADESEALAVVSVPDGLGLPEVDVVMMLADAGLVVGETSEVSSESVAAGNVVAVDPAPGTELPPGASVGLVISTGPAGVVVPDGVGLSEVDLLMLLEAAGLAPGERGEVSDEDIPAGTVIAMDPAPGTELTPGASVDYVVTIGVEPLSGPTPGPSEPAMSELDVTSPWPAFLDRATAFGSALATLTVLYDAAVDQDDEGVVAVAMELRQLAADTLVWLDENPSEPCYSEAWQAFRTAAERLEIAMDAVLTSGFLSAADEYSTMGEATSDMSVALQDAIEACAAPSG